MSDAVVLLSGGMDSATALAVALSEGYRCHALSFDYGQRHDSELTAAALIAGHLGATQHRTMRIDLAAFGGSALTDTTIDVPDSPTQGIPPTYVPARNTVFLSLALAWAEVLDADAIFAGMNAVDYSGYPDCRPEYVDAFAKMANLATRRALEGKPIRIATPLIDLTKSDIIRLGSSLGVDYSQTVSCYRADAQGAACGTCDACRLRSQGFADADLPDVTRYST